MLFPLVMVAVLAGCGDKEDDTGSVDDAFSPQEGHWTSTDEIVSDSCGYTAGMDTGDSVNSGFTLTAVDATTFQVQFDEEDEDDWDKLSCTLSGTDFSCEQKTASNDLSGEGVDAVLESTQDVAGSFSSSTQLAGGAEVHIDCSGSDCGAVADYLELKAFPCVVETAFEATAD